MPPHPARSKPSPPSMPAGACANTPCWPKAPSATGAGRPASSPSATERCSASGCPALLRPDPQLADQRAEGAPELAQLGHEGLRPARLDLDADGFEGSAQGRRAEPPCHLGGQPL